MTVEGETILTGAPRICPDCSRDALRGMTLSSEVGPTAIQTWCSCGAYSRESIYTDNADARKLLAEAQALVETSPEDTLLDALRLLFARYGVAR